MCDSSIHSVIFVTRPVKDGALKVHKHWLCARPNKKAGSLYLHTHTPIHSGWDSGNVWLIFNKQEQK